MTAMATAEDWSQELEGYSGVPKQWFGMPL